MKSAKASSYKSNLKGTNLPAFMPKCSAHVWIFLSKKKWTSTRLHNWIETANDWPEISRLSNVKANRSTAELGGVLASPVERNFLRPDFVHSVHFWPSQDRAQYQNYLGLQKAPVHQRLIRTQHFLFEHQTFEVKDLQFEVLNSQKALCTWHFSLKVKPQLTVLRLRCFRIELSPAETHNERRSDHRKVL